MRRSPAPGRSAVLAVALLAAPLLSPQDVKIDSDTFGGLEARSIGPAAMSGRIAALDAVRGRPAHHLRGRGQRRGLEVRGRRPAVQAGLRQAHPVDRRDRDRPQGPEDGLGGHRRDAGCATASRSATASTRRPTAATTGSTWASRRPSASPASRSTPRTASTRLRLRHRRTPSTPHPERGVFRTTDGGKTWEKVLFVERRHRLRRPRDRPPGRPHRSTPACGSSAARPGLLHLRRPGQRPLQVHRRRQHLEEDPQAGCPKADLGRIAMAVAPSRPSVVYATVEAKEDRALPLRRPGRDAGRRLNTSSVGHRPALLLLRTWWSTRKDANRVYKPGFRLTVSDDGGKTFSTLGGGSLFGASYHGDIHALWINPTRHRRARARHRRRRLPLGRPRRRWRFVGSLPVSQFYHVSYDMEWPYNVYGGLQDNGTWYGPSRRAGPDRRNKHWNSLAARRRLLGLRRSRRTPTWSTRRYQGGNLFRVRKSHAARRKDIKPVAQGGRAEATASTGTRPST